jgi:hypothetical protein
MGAFSILLSLLLILVREDNPKEVMLFTSLKQQYLVTKGIVNNINLKELSIILFFLRLGIGVIESAAPIHLVKIGMPRETLAVILSGTSVFLLFGMLLIGKFMIGKK